jgi:hypothetical protein
MLTRANLRAAIRDIEASARLSPNRAKSLNFDIALGHLYEAYAQMVLDESGSGADITAICGFIRTIDAVSMTRAFSERALSSRAAPPPRSLKRAA